MKNLLVFSPTSEYDTEESEERPRRVHKIDKATSEIVFDIFFSSISKTKSVSFYLR